MYGLCTSHISKKNYSEVPTTLLVNPWTSNLENFANFAKKPAKINESNKYKSTSQTPRMKLIVAN